MRLARGTGQAICLGRTQLSLVLAATAVFLAPATLGSATAPAAPILPPPADEWHPGYVFFNPIMCVSIVPGWMCYFQGVHHYLQTLLD